MKFEKGDILRTDYHNKSYYILVRVLSCNEEAYFSGVVIYNSKETKSYHHVGYNSVWISAKFYKVDTVLDCEAEFMSTLDALELKLCSQKEI